jgi:hypothetical protein
MPGIAINWRMFMVLAHEAKNRAVDAVAENPKVASSDAVAVIVLATASTEAFINELAEVIAVDTAAPAALAALASAVLQIEAQHGRTQDKYLAASKALGAEFDQGVQPWQDFALLIRLRDALIHLKPIEQTDEHGQPTIPKLIAPLEQNQMTYPIESGVHADWTLRIMTDKVAVWAYDAALSILKALVQLAPQNHSVHTLFEWPMHNL